MTRLTQKIKVEMRAIWADRARFHALRDFSRTNIQGCCLSAVVNHQKTVIECPKRLFLLLLKRRRPLLVS